MVLSVVAYRLDRTATHRFLAKRALLICLRLLEHERIIILIASREVLRRRVATDIAIDARRIHVIRTVDVLFYFVSFIGHAKSGMRHLFGLHQSIELFTC